MKIDRLILGSYETNCYILRIAESASACLIVDTGLEAEELIAFLTEYELNPVGVVLTHGHADHITGAALLRTKFLDIKVYIHKLDAEMLTGAPSNLSFLDGGKFSTEPADFLLEHGSIVDQAGIRLEVFHAPGHTPGGICLYSKNEGIVFVGDTLFAGGIGRTDFPGASFAQLKKSIKEKLFTLPDETFCLPGHGPSTTIGHDKSYNQYLQ